MLYAEVAEAMGMRLVEWHIKSTTKASQGLWYDAVSRLRDSQLGNEKVKDIANYIKQGKLWDAFQSDERVVLLVDEIDKTNINFQMICFKELDRMEFIATSRQNNQSQKTTFSNHYINEKDLPMLF